MKGPFGFELDGVGHGVGRDDEGAVGAAGSEEEDGLDVFADVGRTSRRPAVERMKKRAKRSRVLTTSGWGRAKRLPV